MSKFTWVAEIDVFPSRYQKLSDAVIASGHDFLVWSDDWWSTGQFPAPKTTSVVFHGSLSNADRIATELPWSPGSFCETSSFCVIVATGSRSWSSTHSVGPIPMLQIRSPLSWDWKNCYPTSLDVFRWT